jgi:hypothetical protein
MTEEMSIESADEAGQPEVIIAFSFEAGELGVQALPRDERPDPHSLAVILASYIVSNIETLVEQAQEAKARSEATPEPEAAGADLRVIASRPVRSLTTVGGALATGAPEILGPDGRPMQ